MEPLKDRIMADIREGRVTMRPKIFFVLKLALLVGLAVATVAVSAFIVNFILFSIHINSHDTLLQFGPRGWQAFVMFFPWHLLLLDMLLVFGLTRLVRHFRFGYQLPALYVLGGLIGLTLLAGAALEGRTPLNERLDEMRERGLPPPIGGMYRGARMMPPPGSGVCRCTILAIDGNVLVVQDTRRSTTTLRVLLPLNDLRATTTGLKVGDRIFIAGEEIEGTLHAFGVRVDTRLR